MCRVPTVQGKWRVLARMQVPLQGVLQRLSRFIHMRCSWTPGLHAKSREASAETLTLHQTNRTRKPVGADCCRLRSMNAPTMRADTQRLYKLDARQLEVLLNGKDIVGSPIEVEMRPAYTTWVFGSSRAGNRCRLSEGGAVVDITQIKDTADIIYRHRGGIADGALR